MFSHFEHFFSIIKIKYGLQMKDNFEPRYGFVNFAEIWNGRLAMMGILIGLTTELLTGQGILTQMGIG